MHENTDEKTVSEELFPSTFSKTCFIFHKKKRSILKTLLFQYKHFLKLFLKVFISHSIFCHFSINDGENHVKNFVFINHKYGQALVLDIAWTTNIKSVMWVNEFKKMISVANLCLKIFSTFKCDQNDHSMECYSCN